MTRCKRTLGLSLLLAHACLSMASTQLAPSSLFQMILENASSSIIKSSVDAVDASITMVLLESSSNLKLQDITVVVQGITDTNADGTGSAIGVHTAALNFACIAKFQGHEVETEFLDDFILQTFSSSSSEKRFKELLREMNPATFGSVTNVVVSLVSSLTEDSSFQRKLSGAEVAMVAASGTIFVGILCLLCFHRKEDTQSSRLGSRTPRRRSTDDNEKDNDGTPIIKSPPRRMRSTDFFANKHPEPFRTINEEAGSMAGSSVGSFSEGFSSKNWFRDNYTPTDSSVDDSLDDLFHVDVERARQAENEQRERARQEEDERNDQILGASTMLMDWARYIQVIRSVTQTKDANCRLEIEMVSTQSTDIPVESSFDDLSSLEETSASESEAETEHPFEEVEV